MSDPYFVALYRGIIAAIIINGSVVGGLIATGADTRQIVAALIIGVSVTMGQRFLGEGTIDDRRRQQREDELIIKDAAREGFTDDAEPWPEGAKTRDEVMAQPGMLNPYAVDFDEDYHYASNNKDRHRGRLASDCPICLREVVT